jgi:hypothetical protein
MEAPAGTGNSYFGVAKVFRFLSNCGMICLNCSNPIEEERIKIVPHTQVCGSCARLYNVGKRKKGVMVSTGKVGSEIQVLSHDCYQNQEKYLKANGAFSVIKNFSRSVCA